AGELAVDRAPVAAEPPGNLADAQAHLYHAAQAASLLKAEVAVSLSHGDSEHSRCRTWFVSLRRGCHLPVADKTFLDDPELVLIRPLPTANAIGGRENFDLRA